MAKRPPRRNNDAVPDWMTEQADDIPVAKPAGTTQSRPQQPPQPQQPQPAAPPEPEVAAQQDIQQAVEETYHRPSAGSTLHSGRRSGGGGGGRGRRSQPKKVTRRQQAARYTRIMISIVAAILVSLITLTYFGLTPWTVRGCSDAVQIWQQRRVLPNPRLAAGTWQWSWRWSGVAAGRHLNPGEGGHWFTATARNRGREVTVGAYLVAYSGSGMARKYRLAHAIDYTDDVPKDMDLEFTPELNMKDIIQYREHGPMPAEE